MCWDGGMDGCSGLDVRDGEDRCGGLWDLIRGGLRFVAVCVSLGVLRECDRVLPSYLRPPADLGTVHDLPPRAESGVKVWRDAT